MVASREVVSMPVMARVEAAICRSGPCQTVTAKIVMPWVLHGQHVAGNVPENGVFAGLAGVRSS